MKWLRSRYPDNSLFHVLEGQMYVQYRLWSKSGLIFEEILSRYKMGQAGYIDSIAEKTLYYLGQKEMKFRRFKQALPYFEELERLSIELHPDSFYKIFGRLKLGMLYDALGKREEAIERYKSVLLMKDSNKAHHNARQYLDKPYTG